ncbi:delta(14)-sterol reductase LBR-like [Daphnia carinata]|uniref:delta(14)-sterol reductase LBR-like n=1 Tax=Daphnia carinata TaxID=120202 RepID=UPI00257EDE19|nr:delta(14)-sterol reductase LBR-like [Daphnia carinata]
MAFPKKIYKNGESVFGLWPGSGGLYFKGVVVDRDPDTGFYDVKFEEGTTYTLHGKHVKAVDTFKALEPKSAQRGDGKTRRRTASRSRSRSRSRTPGRKTVGKSPVREANSLLTGSSTKKLQQRKNETITGQSPERELAKQRVKMELKEEEVLSVSRVIRRSPRVQTEKNYFEEDEKSLEGLPLSRRKSSRVAVKARVSIPMNQLDSDTFSDDGSSNELSVKPNGKDTVSSTQPAVDSIPSHLQVSSGDGQEMESSHSFTTTVTAILLGNLPLVLFLYLLCKENKCLFQGIPQFTLSDLLSLYNPFVSMGVELFYLAIFILSMLPVGEVIKISEGQYIRRNSFVSAVVLILSLSASKHYFRFSASNLLSHFTQFVIPNVVVSFVLAIIVSYRERQNRSNDTSIISHFVNGSSLHATISGVNIKGWVHRAIFITVIALHLLVLEENIEKNGVISPTLAFVAAMQILYSVEALWNDGNLIHSFDFVHLKTGWAYLTMNAYPLITFLITLCVINSRTELSYVALAPIGLLFFLGLWIKVRSNAQKTAFLKDPDHSSFANMDILTSATGKLLISGWWGWLRHPNYLGDILMHWAFVLPCGFQMVLPYVVALFVTISLVYRAKESDLADKLKYGPSWDRYCQRVPSRLIPRVF